VFIDVWRRCWNRIVSWKPISSPGQALQDRNLLDLINERDKQRLIECGGRYVSLTNEKALLDEIRSSLVVPPSLSSPRGNYDHQSTSSTSSSLSSSTSTSGRARPREDDDDDNDRPAKRQRSSQADADRTPIINRSSSFSLSRWLSDLGLAQYLETFKSNGFEDQDIEMVSSLTQEDLTHLGITKLGHRIKILAEAAKLILASSVGLSYRRTLPQVRDATPVRAHTLRDTPGNVAVISNTPPSQASDQENDDASSLAVSPGVTAVERMRTGMAGRNVTLSDSTARGSLSATPTSGLGLPALSDSIVGHPGPAPTQQAADVRADIRPDGQLRAENWHATFGVVQSPHITQQQSNPETNSALSHQLETGIQRLIQECAVDLNSQLESFCAIFASNLNTLKLPPGLTWHCAPRVGSLPSTAIDRIDLNTLVVIKPELNGFRVTVDASGPTGCTIVVQNNAGKPKRINVDNKVLDLIWTTFATTFLQFLQSHSQFLTNDGDRFLESAEPLMRCTVVFKANNKCAFPATITVAFCLPNRTELFLQRQLSAAGRSVAVRDVRLNLIKLAAAGKHGRQVMCAMSHMARLLLGAEIPTCLFEHVVAAVCETDLANYYPPPLILIWRVSWWRIQTWKPITAADNNDNLFDLVEATNKARLIECAKFFVQLDQEEALMAFFERLSDRSILWTPRLHPWLPNRVRAIVTTFTMLRSVLLQSSLSLLPNELLFEIFQYLPIYIVS